MAYIAPLNCLISDLKNDPNDRRDLKILESKKVFIPYPQKISRKLYLKWICIKLTPSLTIQLPLDTTYGQ